MLELFYASHCYDLKIVYLSLLFSGVVQIYALSLYFSLLNSKMFK